MSEGASESTADLRRQARPYAPIEDYGAIGNLRTVALVSRTGSIDWCCFPELDSPSAFAAILDHARGGRFRIAPAGADGVAHQRYLERTNILETSWQTDAGRLAVIDFMPLRGSIVGSIDAPSIPQIFRLVRSEGGPCDVDVEWSPRLDYARSRMRLERRNSAYVAHGGGQSIGLHGLPGDGRVEQDEDGGPVLRARFRVESGQTVPLLCWFGDEPADWKPADCDVLIRQTAESWREWSSAHDEDEVRAFAGAWQPQLERSALALKLLTYPTTGAIAAAATTSLPEEIGGERNWDYRYTWIRDASFTAQALVSLGHRREAVGFLEWAENVAMQEEGTENTLHLMYTLHGDHDIAERELAHFEGYRQSQPVRIGNKASEQFQLDIYGELLDAAYELVRLGASIDDRLWRFLTWVADQACSRWQEPDYGIWEVRSEKQHFVYSKLMVWVALDRALRLARKLNRPADTARWRRTRAEVRASILEHGYDASRGAFVQAYGSTAFDAANLLIPLTGFLPAEDPRVQSTIDRYLDELTENDLVFRYRTSQTQDGLSGDEGAFGLTTFWMIDALALSGRLDAACRMFENIARRANHVGLYSEELDPTSGMFLGNFPQAFTHIGFINSAVYLAYAEGRPIPSPAPIGSKEEREDADWRSEEGSGD
jgi:GH15 family glucan-1,4-alpha-glucosidase